MEIKSTVLKLEFDLGKLNDSNLNCMFQNYASEVITLRMMSKKIGIFGEPEFLNVSAESNLMSGVIKIYDLSLPSVMDEIDRRNFAGSAQQKFDQLSEMLHLSFSKENGMDKITHFTSAINEISAHILENKPELNDVPISSPVFNIWETFLDKSIWVCKNKMDEYMTIIFDDKVLTPYEEIKGKVVFLGPIRLLEKEAARRMISFGPVQVFTPIPEAATSFVGLAKDLIFKMVPERTEEDSILILIGPELNWGKLEKL